MAGLKKELDEKNALLRYVRALQEVGDSRRVDRKICRKNLDVGKGAFTELIDNMEKDRFDDDLGYPQVEEDLIGDIADIRQSLADKAAEPAGSHSDSSGPLRFR